MARKTAKQLIGRAECPGLLIAVQDSERQGFIRTVNSVFRATNSELFGYVAQDAYSGRAWGEKVLRALSGKDRSLLSFNDGKWQGLLAAFGVARRAWAERNYAGDLFMPDYHSHYADVELTLMALQDGCHAYDPNCVMVEIDYEKDGKPIHGPDRSLYLQRLQSGFAGRVSSPKLLDLFR